MKKINKAGYQQEFWPFKEAIKDYVINYLNNNKSY